MQEASRHIGDRVMYRGGASSEDEPGVIEEVGVEFVYVRYDRSQRVQATLPGNLELIEEEKVTAEEHVMTATPVVVLECSCGHREEATQEEAADKVIAHMGWKTSR